ncbi:MAG: hypothetical protein ACLGJC_09395 [Alphaproteobacteria bacterium]
MNAIIRIPTDDAQPIAGIGHNGAPEPTPFERVRDKIDKLFDEAKLYLDGEPVASQGVADDIANLLNMIRSAENEADDERKKEAKPHDDAKAEIQARYNALIGNTKTVKGKTVLASEACKKALAPWLQKVEAEKAAAAEAARREADEKRRVAEEAIRSRDAANLEQTAAAEALLKDAKKADAAAKKAEKDGAKAGSSTFGRAISTRTVWNTSMTNSVEALKHYRATKPEELKAFLLSLAEADVRSGARSIPGFSITPETKVV